MKVVVLSFYSFSTPHFETELEIISNHLDNNDDVYVLHCDGLLQSCMQNPEKNLSNCYHCKTRFNAGMKLINTNKNKAKIIPFLRIKQPVNGLKYDFENVEELKNYQVNGKDFGMGAASSLISRFSDHYFDTVKYKEEIRINLDMAVETYFAFKKYLEEIKPDVAYFFNGRFAEIRGARRAAEELKIKTIIHERGGNMYKYELFENTTPHDFDSVQEKIKEFWENGEADKEK
jgi:hypothetical protein